MKRDMTTPSIIIELSSPRVGVIRHTLAANAQSDVVADALRSAIGLFSLMYDNQERAAFLRELGSNLTVLAHETE